MRDRERRQRLLEAALELYGTNGYRATTVQVVCQLAKVSTRSSYELYADHEQLLTELYISLYEEVLAAIADVGETHGPDAFSAVQQLVAGALGPMLSDERKARVMEVEVVGISAALERHAGSPFAGLPLPWTRAWIPWLNAACSALRPMAWAA